MKPFAAIVCAVSIVICIITAVELPITLGLLLSLSPLTAFIFLGAIGKFDHSEVTDVKNSRIS